MKRDAPAILFLCTILLFAFISGCELAKPSLTPTDSDRFIPTSTIRPSITISATIPTVTIPASLTQIPSPAALSTTSRPSKTSTQTPTQVWTPHPTLNSDEAKTVIQELLVTNGDCRLPCWWGITPGQTTWAEAWRILSPLMTDLFISPLEGYFTFYFWVPTSFQPDGKIAVRLVVRDDKVESIRVVVNSTLQEFLETNGPPGQVQLFTDGAPPGTDPSGYYILALFYPEKGILAFYDGVEQYGDIMDICPSRITTLGTGVFLWSPEKEISLEQALEFSFVGELVEYFYPLEDISEMTTTDFYETFVKPENVAACIRVDNPYFP
jgi:hypothetical protein